VFNLTGQNVSHEFNLTLSVLMFHFNSFLCLIQLELSKVLMVIMKMAVIWDVMPYSLSGT
jgi:hypothetical protein